MSGPTLRGIFNRVDTNRDGVVDKGEVKKFAEGAGVGDGLFGGKKVSGAADAFMDNFDASKDGKVGWDEFVNKGATLIPGAGTDVSAEGLRKKGGELVAAADQDHDNALTKNEIKDAIEPQLAGQSMAGTKADIAAKLAVQMLDDNGNRKVERSEVDSLANDIAIEVARLRRA